MQTFVVKLGFTNTSRHLLTLCKSIKSPLFFAFRNSNKINLTQCGGNYALRLGSLQNLRTAMRTNSGFLKAARLFDRKVPKREVIKGGATKVAYQVSKLSQTIFNCRRSWHNFLFSLSDNRSTIQ